MKDFDKNLKLLFVLLTINLLSIHMGNVFVNFFIMKESATLIEVLNFNLMSFIMQLAAFYIGGWTCKKWDVRMGLYLGIGSSCILYGVLLLLQQDAVTYAFILGCLSGLSQGFFWLSMNPLMVMLTNASNRKQFNSIFGTLASLSQMLGPILASLIVWIWHGINGYIVIFALLLGCMIIALFVSCKMHVITSASSYHFIKTWNQSKKKQLKTYGKGIRKLYYREGVLAFLINTLLFAKYQQEATVSLWIFFMTLICMISYQACSHIRIALSKYYQIGTIIGICSLPILVYGFSSSWGILCFMILYGISMPFCMHATNYQGQNIIQELNFEENALIELTTIRETYIACGRIVGTFVILLIYLTTLSFSMLWIYMLSAILLALSSIRDISHNETHIS